MPLRDVGDVSDAVPTQRSGGQPEYEPIRSACNRIAQLSTCTYLLQRRCKSGARPSLTAPRHSLREALYCACVSLVYMHAWLNFKMQVYVSNSCGGSFVVWRSFFLHSSSHFYDLTCPLLSPLSHPLFL